MTQLVNRPARTVLEAFGLEGLEPFRLSGGEGRTWAVGDAVLKPISGDEEEAASIAEVYADLPERGFRVPRPLRSADGRWVVDGWVAWTRVEGRHDFEGKWSEVIAVGERFHAQLQGIPRPAFLDNRRTPWDAGDRAAWGEIPLALKSPELSRLVERLKPLLRPTKLPFQLIHGDLPGNVLFADPLPPAIIDFSPYWRPAGFALAVIVVDAIAWYGADKTLVDAVSHLEELDQLIARAVVYRIVTADVLSESAGSRFVAANLAAYQPLAELAENIAAS